MTGGMGSEDVSSRILMVRIVSLTLLVITNDSYSQSLGNINHEITKAQREPV